MPPPYRKFMFEFSSKAVAEGKAACRQELIEYLRKHVDSRESPYEEIQLAGVINSTLEVNEAAWTLINAACEDKSVVVLGTTGLSPPKAENKLEEIVAGSMSYQGLQPGANLTIWEMRSGCSLMKHQKHVARRDMSHSGIYIYPIFAEMERTRLFIMYPVLAELESEDVKAEICDWFMRLSTTVLTATQEEKPLLKVNLTGGSSWTFDFTTLIQYLKASTGQDLYMIPKKCDSFAWLKTRTLTMLHSPCSAWVTTEQQSCKMDSFLSVAFSSCQQQSVTPATFKASLDALQHKAHAKMRANAAAKSDFMLRPEVMADYCLAHRAKFTQLVGSLHKVLFLREEDLDDEFELFVKELAEKTLPEYKSSGYYLELLELLAKRSFEWEYKAFKDAYVAKTQLFLDHDKEMEAKFSDIEGMLKSAWEAGTLKDFVDSLPKLYSFDLTGIKIESGDFRLLPQYQLWTTKRHDYHEHCVRSAVEALENVSQKLELDFADHFMNPKVVPLPENVNHSETKGLFTEKESIATIVRNGLDEKYFQLLSVTEARKASVEDRLARNERQLREEELVLMKEQFGVALDQLHAMALMKKD